MATIGRWLLMLLILWKRTGLSIMQAEGATMTLTEAARLQTQQRDLYGITASAPAFLLETTGSLWIQVNLRSACSGKMNIIAGNIRVGTWLSRIYTGKRFLSMT